MSWAEFQSICVDVMRSAWDDPAASEFGRLGQKQHGIDIFGRRMLSDGSERIVGAQCKDRQVLKVSELEKDHKQAKQFTPHLSEFWILTTSEKDAKVQQAVEAFAATLPTRIWFWEDICQELTKHPNLVAKHFTGWPSHQACNPRDPRPVPSEVLLVHSRAGRDGASGLSERIHAWAKERSLDLSIGVVHHSEASGLGPRSRPQRLLVPVIASNDDMLEGAVVDQVFDCARGDMRTAVAMAYIKRVGGDWEDYFGAINPGTWPCLATPTAANLKILNDWAVEPGGPLQAKNLRLAVDNKLWLAGVPIERDMRPLNAPPNILPRFVVCRDCLDDHDELVLEIALKNRGDDDCVISGVGGEFRAGFWQKYSYGEMEPYVLKSIASVVVDVKELTKSRHSFCSKFGTRRLARKLFVKQMEDSIVVPPGKLVRITVKYLNTSVLGDVFIFEPVVDSNFGLQRLGPILCHAGTALMG